MTTIQRFAKHQEEAMIAFAHLSPENTLNTVDLRDLSGPFPGLNQCFIHRCQLVSSQEEALNLRSSELVGCGVPETSLLRLNAVQSNFSGGVAHNISLVGSFLVTCQFSDWDFRASTFERTMFRDCQFVGSDFSWSTFKSSTFEYSLLRPLGLQGTHLEFHECVFIHCDLNDQLNVDGSSFRSCLFVNCSIKPDLRLMLKQNGCSFLEWEVAKTLEKVDSSSPANTDLAKPGIQPSEKASRFKALEAMQGDQT